MKQDIILNIDVDFSKVEIEEVEPDGSKCHDCGDVIYLGQYKVWLNLIIGKKINPWKRCISLNCCQSCIDSVKEEFNR